ncbi:MAG: hypothetical protein K8S54_12585 [Spirochaetia bacterium]|nr:hypothetical protein [Spirochaetia bacterium]
MTGFLLQERYPLKLAQSPDGFYASQKAASWKKERRGDFHDTIKSGGSA